MCKEQEYFCIRRGLFKKKKLFSELEEKWQFFECQLKKRVLRCKKKGQKKNKKTKKNQKQGFRVIYINVEILHYFLI